MVNVKSGRGEGVEKEISIVKGSRKFEQGPTMKKIHRRTPCEGSSQINTPSASKRGEKRVVLHPLGGLGRSARVGRSLILSNLT